MTELATYQEAINEINLCKDAKKIILGIEGFEKIGNEHKPNMDMIADFSNLSQEEKASEKSYVAALNFTKEFDSNNDGLLFEIVY